MESEALKSVLTSGRIPRRPKLRLPKVNCTYGAPYGRQSELPDNCDRPIRLRMTRLKWVDGDYDQGGAYWGNTGKNYIYWATDEKDVNIFVRGVHRDDAKVRVRNIVSGARFYN